MRRPIPQPRRSTNCNGSQLRGNFGNSHAITEHFFPTSVHPVTTGYFQPLVSPSVTKPFTTPFRPTSCARELNTIICYRKLGRVAAMTCPSGVEATPGLHLRFRNPENRSLWVGLYRTQRQCSTWQLSRSYETSCESHTSLAAVMSCDDGSQTTVMVIDQKRTHLTAKRSVSGNGKAGCSQAHTKGSPPILPTYRQ